MTCVDCGRQYVLTLALESPICMRCVKLRREHEATRRSWEARMREERGQAWLDDNMQRLDVEWEYVKTLL